MYYICVVTNSVETNKYEMGEILKKRLKMNKVVLAREELSLNLKVASSMLSNRMDKLISGYGITASQYNVLRILKGVYPVGHPRCEIALRMIETAPDITRLIDRLEKQGLVTRDRTQQDRRMSITKLTEKGLNLVDEIKPIMDREHKNATKNLTEEECRKLSYLLEKMYRNSD
jgi:DNA-binding MarR family transcriptional regulator